MRTPSCTSVDSARPLPVTSELKLRTVPIGRREGERRGGEGFAEFHLDSDILDGASRVLTNERIPVNRYGKYFHHDGIANARLVYNRDGSC